MCDSILFVEDEESVDQLLLMIMVEFQANDLTTLARVTFLFLHRPSSTYVLY